jgi:4-aminobutyrate aminotransferase-like enzyme
MSPRAQYPRRTAAILRRLRAYESRNVTHLDPAAGWPIVWTRARDCHVWDAEGRRYLDLTAAFGVAAAGHANPRVVRAGQRQMARLLHAMGDVHPHPLKADLARALSRITFERWTGGRFRAKCLFTNSGFEAVEAALKTALLATGRPGVLAFAGGYHGLGYGALTTTHREYFRAPFRPQLAGFAAFAPYPGQPAEVAPALEEVQRRLRAGNIGAVLVEPVQGRGGIRVPPPEFLPALRAACTRHGAWLVLDEIYTGLGRTGRWFACEHTGVVPDLVCLGKALTGGFPLSVCVGRADLMDAAWPESPGEALHTSTYLGHPVGCAMALAQMAELRRRRLVERSARLGAVLRRALESLRAPEGGWRLAVRGLGLMAGLELRRPDGAPAGAEALRVVQALLRRGYVLLPEGEHGEVISFTPPLTIGETDLRRCVRALGEVLREECRR